METARPIPHIPPTWPPEDGSNAYNRAKNIGVSSRHYYATLYRQNTHDNTALDKHKIPASSQQPPLFEVMDNEQKIPLDEDFEIAHPDVKEVNGLDDKKFEKVKRMLSTEEGVVLNLKKYFEKEMQGKGIRMQVVHGQKLNKLARLALHNYIYTQGNMPVEKNVRNRDVFYVPRRELAFVNPDEPAREPAEGRWNAQDEHPELLEISKARTIPNMSESDRKLFKIVSAIVTGKELSEEDDDESETEDEHRPPSSPDDAQPPARRQPSPEPPHELNIDEEDELQGPVHTPQSVKDFLNDAMSMMNILLYKFLPNNVRDFLPDKTDECKKILKTIIAMLANLSVSGIAPRYETQVNSSLNKAVELFITLKDDRDHNEFDVFKTVIHEPTINELNCTKQRIQQLYENISLKAKEALNIRLSINTRLEALIHLKLLWTESMCCISKTPLRNIQPAHKVTNFSQVYNNAYTSVSEQLKKDGASVYREIATALKNSKINLHQYRSSENSKKMVAQTCLHLFYKRCAQLNQGIPNMQNIQSDDAPVFRVDVLAKQALLALAEYVTLANTHDHGPLVETFDVNKAIKTFHEARKQCNQTCHTFAEFFSDMRQDSKRYIHKQILRIIWYLDEVRRLPKSLRNEPYKKILNVEFDSSQESHDVDDNTLFKKVKALFPNIRTSDAGVEFSSKRYKTSSDEDPSRKTRYSKRPRKAVGALLEKDLNKNRPMWNASCIQPIGEWRGNDTEPARWLGLTTPVDTLPEEFALTPEFKEGREYFSSNTGGTMRQLIKTLTTEAHMDRAYLMTQDLFKRKDELREPFARNGRFVQRALHTAYMWNNHAKLLLFYRFNTQTNAEELIGFSLYGAHQRNTEAVRVIFTEPRLNEWMNSDQVVSLNMFCPGRIYAEPADDQQRADNHRHRRLLLGATLWSMYKYVVGKNAKAVVCRVKEVAPIPDPNAGRVATNGEEYPYWTYPLAPLLYDVGFRRVFRWINYGHESKADASVRLAPTQDTFGILNDNSYRYIMREWLWRFLRDAFLVSEDSTLCVNVTTSRRRRKACVPCLPTTQPRGKPISKRRRSRDDQEDDGENEDSDDALDFIELSSIITSSSSSNSGQRSQRSSVLPTIVPSRLEDSAHAIQQTALQIPVVSATRSPLRPNERLDAINHNARQQSSVVSETRSPLTPDEPLDAINHNAPQRPVEDEFPWDEEVVASGTLNGTIDTINQPAYNPATPATVQKTVYNTDQTYHGGIGESVNVHLYLEISI